MEVDNYGLEDLELRPCLSLLPASISYDHQKSPSPFRNWSNIHVRYVL